MQVPHSVCGRTHKANVILTISGHEVLFISLQNDYDMSGVSIPKITAFPGLHAQLLSLAVLQATKAGHGGLEMRPGNERGFYS